MPKIITASYPIAFWDAILRRNQEALADLEKKVTELLQPVPVTIDTEKQVLAVIAVRQQTINNYLQDSAYRQFLEYHIEAQLAVARLNAGIPQIDQHINNLSKRLAMPNLIVSKVGLRDVIKQELADVQERFTALQHGGHSEAIAAERQALKSYQVLYSVFNAAEVQSLVQQIQEFKTNKEMLELTRQERMVTSRVSLIFEEDLAPLLTAMSVSVQPYVDAPQPALDAPTAPAEQPAATDKPTAAAV